MGAFGKEVVPGNPNAYRPSAPLDDLLRTIRLTAVLQASAYLGAPWGADMPEQDALKIYLLLSGSCVAYLPGRKQMIRASAGDAIVVPPARRHALADAASSRLTPLGALLPTEKRRADSPDDYIADMFRVPAVHGGGERTHILTLCLFVDRRFPSIVLKSLSDLVHLPGLVSRNRAFIEHVTDQIASYGARGFAGQSIATRLAESILTVCLKEHLESDWRRASNAYGALNDPFLAKVIVAVHESPESKWSIRKLAEKAGLSRSAFLKRFQDAVGQTPLDFVTSLRMARALELLETTRESVREIAWEVGYSSDASFNRAFSRWFGGTPGAVRDRAAARRHLETIGHEMTTVER